MHADEWDVVGELAHALDRQTAAGEIELVLVSSQRFEVGNGRAIQVRLVVAGGGGGSRQRAEGVRSATGEIVALGETHVLPTSEWAHACLDEHERGAVAVLPLMTNANPASALSWASFLMDYGRYAGRSTASTVVPTYNATVRRDVLLALPALERVLEPGPYLDRALRAQGATVAHAPGAVLAHVNIDTPTHWVRERIVGGLLLGRSRRSLFGTPRRIVYAAAFPLIAAMLFTRALRAPRDGSARGTLPALALACTLYAIGEAAGYIGLGGARAERRMLMYEVHKRRYVRSFS